MKNNRKIILTFLLVGSLVFIFALGVKADWCSDSYCNVHGPTDYYTKCCPGGSPCVTVGYGDKGGGCYYYDHPTGECDQHVSGVLCPGGEEVTIDTYLIWTSYGSGGMCFEPTSWCTCWEHFLGTCPTGPSDDFCTVSSCKAYGYQDTTKATCYISCGSGYKKLGEFQTTDCPFETCSCCAPSCSDGVCNYGETCSTCPADCGACSVGHIRIQGPNGIIKLNLISAADAIAAGRGTVKVARFNGDVNSAAELVPVTDPKASPVRIKTQQGIFSWAELP